MTSSLENYTVPVPLRYTPHAIKYVRELAEKSDDGSIEQAVAELFEQAGITIGIEGDTSLWTGEEQENGALFVGDHRNGLEYPILLAVLGQKGLEGHAIGKPVSWQARVIGSLGIKGTGLLLPVMPRTLASDRENKRKFNRDLYWRIVNRGRLPSQEQIRAINEETLNDATDLLANGKTVTIFPAGGVMDARIHPWHQGVGKVIEQLPVEAQDNVAVVPFRFKDFSRTKLLYSLDRASKGRKPHPYKIILELGRQGFVNELFHADDDSLSPIEITETLRQQYVTNFST
jgi:hypothetical protein